MKTFKYKGYMGKMLRVNLSAETLTDFHVPETVCEQYLGGKGVGAKLLYDLLPPHVDPLSPQNILIVNTGPLTGSGGPCTSRFNVTTKSPLTHGIGDSNCGGDFGIQLKKAGYDGVIIEGKAREPIYIDITDNHAEIKSASELWGLTTERVQELLGKETGKVVIGPAGENLVRYACILSGERAAGRCGTGAVMGSKNLKAIVASGSQSVAFHDKERFQAIVKAWTATLRDHPMTGERLPTYGTTGLMSKLNDMGALATQNFEFGKFDAIDTINEKVFRDKHLVRNKGCRTCPIKCGRVVNFEDRELKGPEFETMVMFGPNINNSDICSIIRWNVLMDSYGIDTITTGVVLAFAMELKARGLLNISLSWNNHQAIDKLIQDIAYRRGIGDDLAEGTLKLAKKYGAHDAAIQVKGLEMAAYNPKALNGMALGYATSNRGACHLAAGYVVYFEGLGPLRLNPFSNRGKAYLVMFQQNLMDAVSAAGNCLFTTFAIAHKLLHKLEGGFIHHCLNQIVLFVLPLFRYQHALYRFFFLKSLPGLYQIKAVESLTGIKLNLADFIRIGERVFTICRLFNVREGFDSTADVLPGKITAVPHLDLDRMKRNYYAARGWNEHGIPTEERLKDLGISIGDAPPK